MVHILEALYENDLKEDLHWPQLSAITVVPARHTKVVYKKEILAYVVKLVAIRFQRGNPISTINLSSEIVVRGTQRQMHRLRDQVDFIEC
jgi:hypothetical protein